jgi:hypothetical protein
MLRNTLRALCPYCVLPLNWHSLNVDHRHGPSNPPFFLVQMDPSHVHEAVAEHMHLERKITDVIRHIPCTPRSALEVFEQERLESLSRAGSVPLTPDLQQHFLMEFQNLSHAERGTLRQRGIQAHQTMTAQSYELLRTVLISCFLVNTCSQVALMC